ncbi:hypothetical protein C5167_032404 [Papaver somniferum]|uniref:Uncharacterized protein n=1 Tax=Papaver somniferum TaxID=3469 RepID=A0A4Y7KAU4_PAPSO|nr:hypothetical protein C5167_032404 [Papaver somniferum]
MINVFKLTSQCIRRDCTELAASSALYVGVPRQLQFIRTSMVSSGTKRMKAPPPSSKSAKTRLVSYCSKAIKREIHHPLRSKVCAEVLKRMRRRRRRAITTADYNSEALHE